jgi:hypothetical protein
MSNKGNVRRFTDRIVSLVAGTKSASRIPPVAYPPFRTTPNLFLRFRAEQGYLIRK